MQAMLWMSLELPSAILPLSCEPLNGLAASQKEVLFPGMVNLGVLGPECHLCLREGTSS